MAFLVTKVAEFETKLDEVKATVSEHQPPVSEEAIFQQMAEIVQHEQDGDETDDGSSFFFLKNCFIYVL